MGKYSIDTDSSYVIIMEADNTRMLCGGGINTYDLERNGSLGKVDVLWNTIQGYKVLPGWENLTDQKIVLSKSYRTTTRGTADEISIMPGEVITRTMAGDASIFSIYRVKPVEEADFEEIEFQTCSQSGQI